MIISDGINVLSLFDGMSCGKIALDRSGIAVNKYCASEVDKHAISVSKHNWGDSVTHMGDIRGWADWDINWPSVDLILAGSPCQGFSFAGKQLAFDDPRSALFFVFIDILDRVKKANPNVKFLLENVRMQKDYLSVISEMTGVEPVLINSALVSAQSRKRYYWCNWDIEQPKDKGILLADILDIDLTADAAGARILGRRLNDEGERDNQKTNCAGAVIRDKSKCLRVGGRNSPWGCKQEWDSPFIKTDTRLSIDTTIRRFTPVECERLQTVPDGYTQSASDTQRYKMLGNGWTVDVIKHILDSSGLHNFKNEQRGQDD